MAEDLPILPQTAVLAFRREPELQVLLLLREGKRRWGVPKGIIDPGQSSEDTCRLESLEEAGIEGALSDRPIGRFSYEKWGYRCEVDVYLMRVETQHERWLEDDIRRREWYGYEEAARVCGWPELRRMIRKLPRWIEERGL